MLRTPSGGVGHGTAAMDNGLMSIGTVLNVLRDEFPEVTISKIRFLESEGLIEPQRTPSGYRKFSPGDVERLGHVLRMQRDHYLPLKVIREHLDAVERGEALPLPSVGRQRDGEALCESEGPTVARIGRAELLAAVEIGEQELEEWESYGLITPLPEGVYDAEAVTVAGLVVELGRFGIEPRHLRAVKAAADREAGLVDQVVAPLRRHRNPQTRAHAEAQTKELAGLAVKLHAALVQSALGVRLP
ncbi:MerR family transcriptional regulator [Streptomyces phaeochromogenes]|jgi:DNA-binding transcriptional MerR regulator|uniref:MerR family transcriptional regulator n=1 Tax=Streptomyces phaeochromogenes TaxID=1923 RepID=A0ABZ1HMQ7_STRPH|nr:MerR family transcriptional regulator [Streptomyces phaeochromogenes]MCX5598572.1 MerR family transcriptional regulator [Streptomyces phaeochromogenes]WRZ33823.1 MerR family transcriptional regulator [Streptomyces phaeochromogenes]WSD19314.1 MerR family transcriptional regulator [Streptomyces phaeochromogenes]WSS97761.1 MerR family transcriptional regulator [Streptomyces phaeochromogenes]WSW13198.1 MerR family transcriptional regulator [Streptomyces phaeochromogenes]